MAQVDWRRASTAGGGPVRQVVTNRQQERHDCTTAEGMRRISVSGRQRQHRIEASVARHLTHGLVSLRFTIELTTSALRRTA